jgi:AhpD family alkylhydroperoxidase
MLDVSKYLRNSGLEESLLYLVDLRVSQINGCAFCIDMHWKDLRAVGETEQRLYGLDAWGESPYYSDRERASLAWTEAVPMLRVATCRTKWMNRFPFFSEKELADLTLAIVLISGWNRLNISLRTVPDTHEPAKARELKKPA